MPSPAKSLERRERLHQILSESAARGSPCPTNEDLQTLLDCSLFTLNRDLRALRPGVQFERHGTSKRRVRVAGAVSAWNRDPAPEPFKGVSFQ